MRKVVVTELLSLEGVAEAPNTFFFDWDEVVDAQGAAIIETRRTVTCRTAAVHADLPHYRSLAKGHSTAP